MIIHLDDELGPPLVAYPDVSPAIMVGPRSSSRSRRTRRSPHTPRTVSVVAPGSLWDDVRQAMLGARPRGDEEVLGFLFCARHRTNTEDRYLVKHWVVPSPDDYIHQSIGGLALKQAFHVHLLTTYIAQGLHIVHLHTHPGSHLPSFSTTDDRDERAQSAALFDLPGSPRLISGVFNQTMEQGTFRIWSGAWGTHQPAALNTSWVPAGTSTPTIDTVRFDRQRIFGEPVQRRLGQLTVALIGCGGLGAPFAEQLARLGVRSWILVDDDQIERTNLHRLPFSTQRMVDRGTTKVDYVAGLIRRFWENDARIRTMPRSVESSPVQHAVATADLIVVATDNHHSRLLAQQLALRCMRPLLCLGTHIEQRPDEPQPRIYSRVTMPPLAGGWCLPCAQVINLTTAAEELADPLTRAQLAAGGYLPQVSAPAIYWVNTVGAAMGVRLVHGSVAGFLDTRHGIDDLFDLASGMWMPISHDRHPGCYFCSPGGLLASA